MSANTSIQTVTAAGTVVSATGQIGQPVVTEQGIEADVYVAVTAAGTTITIQAETSPDGGVTWYPHTAFAAITVAGNSLLKLASNVGRLMRLNVTAITGSFTLGAWIGTKRGTP